MNTFQKLIEKYPNKPWWWSRCGLSKNPSITSEFIEKHIDKPWWWGIWGVSSNTFNFDYFQFKNKRQLALKNTINESLENWLWKPMCNDNTISINPRLSIKELKI